VIGIVGVGRTQDLDRDVAVQRRIAGPIHLPLFNFANHRLAQGYAVANSNTGHDAAAGRAWR
jgi:hypothetical protein